MRLSNFFNSSNENRTIQISRFISLLIGIQGLFMAILNLESKSNRFTVIISITYGTIMLLNYIYLSIAKKMTVFYISAIVVIFGLEYSFLVNGGTEGFGVIWLTVIPLFTVYLLNTTFFYVCNSVFLVILATAMWSPLNNYIYDFNEAFELRFPLVYALTFLFGAFLKYRIRKTEKDLEYQKYLLATEIHQAALIQQAFFKQNKLDFDNWEIAINNIPMSEVTGDMYDIYTENDRLDGIGLFDISGHGISSGLITMLTKNIIHQEFYSNINADLQSIVTNIDNHLTRVKGEIENYLTGLMIRTFDNHVDIVNAGHMLPLIYKAKDKSTKLLKRDPAAMGALGIKYLPSVYINQKVDIESGDEVILYTDGLLEFRNKKNELFGIERLTASFEKVKDMDPERQVELITKELKLFAEDTKQEDDMTIMILKRK